MKKSSTSPTSFHRSMAKALMLLALIPALPVFGASGVWTNPAGGSWANAANWSGGTIAGSVGSVADFTTLALTADATVTLDGIRTNGIVTFGDTTFSHNWIVNGGAGGSLFMTNTGTAGAVIAVTNDETLTISVPVAGGGGFTKTGPGNLVFTGTNTVTSSSVFTNGTVTYSGAGANNDSGGINGAQYLYLGSNNGHMVFNMNSSGTVSYGDSNSKIYVGGTANTGGGTDTAQAVINQISGTLNLNVGQNLKIAAGSVSSYGCVNLTGGTMNIGGTATVGYGGSAVFNQSGGALTVTKFFGVGDFAGSVAAATFTGGTATFSSAGASDISIGDAGGANTFASFNVGTLAGGNAVITAANVGNATYKGTRLGSAASLTANLNLNSGTFIANNVIYRNNTAANAYVNFEGGTLRAGTSCTVLSNNLSAVNVYRDGAVIDSQSFNVTCLANLQSAAASGIYPAGGGYAYTSGAGYIGVPYVAVTGGSGSGAYAVATISGGQVTGVVMTCPGQGYVAGDMITFAFSGGGSTTPATSYVYTLTSGDLSSTTGGLTKLGTGTLNLAGTNTYGGATTINGGNLVISPANGAATGNYTVTNGAKLTARASFVGDQMTASAITFNAGSALTLDETAFSGPLVAVVNALTASSTVSVNLTNMTISAGQYPLISYGNLGGAGFSAFSLGVVPPSLGLALSLSNNVANHTIDLVAVTATAVTWNGNINGSWDIGGTANWQGNQYYVQPGGVGLLVNFDDTATGTTAVTLNTAVAPSGMLVNNSSLTYAISGSGNISGNGILVKQGSGTLTLATANTMTNTTTISAGTLQLGDGSSANGSLGGNIADNSALVIANPATQTVNNLISGTGTLTKSGSGTLTLTSSNTLNGAVTVNTGTLVLNPGGTGGNVPVLGSVSGVSVASGATLSLAGANSLGTSNAILPAVSIADTGSLSTTTAGTTNYVSGLALGASTLSGPGTLFVAGNLTNNSTATVNLSLNSASTNVFLASGSALTVNNNLNLAVGTANGSSQFIFGNLSGGPATLTTMGNVKALSQFLEIDNMNWNFDLGTNTMLMTSKLTVSKSPFLPVYMNWLSGTGMIASGNGFAIADGAGLAQAYLEVTGGSLVISNVAFRAAIGNGGAGQIDVSGGALSFLGTDPIQLGGDIKYAASGASGTLNVTTNGSVLFGPLCPGLRLAADLNNGIQVSPVTGTINLNGGTMTVFGNITNGSTGPTDSGGSSYINFNGGTLKAGTNNAQFLQGLTQATVQSGGATIDDGGNVVVIGQSLTDGGGGLTKLGTGTLALTNASSYSGPTVISNGTLEVDGSIAGSGVSVVQGSLAGVGTVGASVTVGSTGILAAGTNGLGALTINGNLQLAGSVFVAVNKSLAESNGTTVVSGAINNTGTGIVTATNVGTALVVGDTFALFNQPVVNGNALTIPTVGGVTWTNMLALNGTIQVLSVAPTINPLPGPVQYSVSGGQLTLAWPTNLGWILQAQTNALTIGITTNWVNVAGSTSVTNLNVGIDPAKGTVFYRLAHP